LSQAEAEPWWSFYDLKGNSLQIRGLELIKRDIGDAIAQVVVQQDQSVVMATRGPSDFCPIEVVMQRVANTVDVTYRAEA
jgi:hypothetical protein